MRLRPTFLGALCAVIAACSDTLGPESGAHPDITTGYGAGVLTTVRCEASRVQKNIDCIAEIAPAGGASRAVLGNNQIKLRSSNVHYDSATRLFSFDVTLQNLLTQPIGTPDGTTVIGSKVFYADGPRVTSFVAGMDTGTISVANADGFKNFTGPHQPYHLYSIILAPNEISGVKPWHLSMPPTVNTFTFVLKVFSAVPNEPKVPATAPDSVPASIYAQSNIATDLQGLTGQYLKDIVTVVFAPDADIEERQAAIDQVAGTVVGGMRLPDGDGMYYVRISADGTANGLVNSSNTLNKLPQVLGASPEFLYDSAAIEDYRKPSEGAGWDTWNLNRHTAGIDTSHQNWALEAIDAPHAWGCETGSTSVRVALLDRGFHLQAIPELAANAGGQVQFGNALGPSDPADHGAGTASALAARGNDGSGMTGVMWNVDLRLFEFGTTGLGAPTTASASNVVDRIGFMLVDNPRVISMSIGNRPSPAAVARIKQGLATRSDTNAVLFKRTGLRRWLRRAALFGVRPLVVVSAGNSTIDAWWNGFPAAALDLPNQVLVVGAAAKTLPGSGHGGGDFSHPTFSNTGSTVEISAPGVGVYTHNGTGAIGKVNGTSISTPLVAGAAGLLFSFDPRLTAADVKQLLIDGARAGNNTVPNGTGPDIPVLNVYESLKLAAQRSGAPLCGSRVWRSGGAVMTLRNGVATPLFSVDPAAYISDLEVLHGGKSVRFYDRTASAYQLATWQNGIWTPATIPNGHPSFAFSAPSYLSWQGVSHDEDSASYVIPGAGNVAEVYVASTQTGSERLVTSFQLSQSGTGGSSECTKLQQGGSNAGACLASLVTISTSYQTLSQPAYSPLGTELYLGLNSWTDATRVDPGWVYCPGYDPLALPAQYELCRGYTRTSTSTAGAIYAVDLKTGVPRVLASQSGAAFLDISAADGGRDEFNTEMSTLNHTERHDWVLGGASPQLVSLVPGRTCVTEYRRLSSGAVLYTAASCGAADVTFAPLRAPISSPATRR